MSDPRDFLSAWRSLQLVGSRDVIDGAVASEHQGPSAALAECLEQWPGAWYWGDDARTRLVLIRGTAPARPERWLWHGALLILTVVCSLAAGTVLQGKLHVPSHPGIGGAITGVGEFARFVIEGGWRILPSGIGFAGPLLLILSVHELGHYFAARRYAIDVSPPYFIPLPPNLSPMGGLGAFIRLRSAVYDRRQLLDVGAAGPLAGFVVALAVVAWGYHTSHRVTLPISSEPSIIFFAGQPLVLGESLLTGRLRDWLVPGVGAVALSPQAFAGWVGMFITGLNLLPLSQLDGGHVLYGLAGRHQRIIAIVVAIGLVILAQRASMWYLWVALTFAIGGGGWTHPPVVIPERPVLRFGRLVGLACAIVFALTFVPVPFPG